MGDPVLAGSVDASAETIAVRGAGHDIWGEWDEFQFAYRQLSGDVDISVRVDRLTHVDDWTKAGIMIRESLSRDARHAFMLVSAASGLALQWRSQPGAATAHAGGGTGGAPAWIRLVRSGTRFAAYRSSNGTTWNLVATAEIGMSSQVYVGLAVTSHSPWQMAEATFTNLRLQTAGTPTPTGWTNLDIGEPALSGSFSSGGTGSMTVTGAGADIWGDWDQFHFVFRSVTGDADIVARIASQQYTDEWAKAGLMIREGLTGSSAHASIFATGSYGWAFQHRPWNSAESRHSHAGSGAAPGWIRLTRSGDLFTAFRSADGKTWQTAGNATIPMSATVHVGLAVTSHVVSLRSAAAFDSVTIASGSTGPGTPGGSGDGSDPPPVEEPPPGGTPPPPGTLPAEWQTGDIGDPDVTGSASYASGTFSVTGAGDDIWNLSDQFRFVYRPMAGDAQIVARIASLTAPDPWTKGGVMIRETLSGPSKNVSLFATGSNGWSLQRRASTGGASEFTSVGSGSAPGWLRLVRQGDRFSAYLSADGSSWQLAGTSSVAMAAEVYVGLAVTSHSVATSATATFTNVSVTPPMAEELTGTLTVTNPDGSTTFVAPATLAISATYTGGTTRPARVDFFRGETLIGSDTSSPFSVTWSSVPAGEYTIAAAARDQSGATISFVSTKVVVTSTSLHPRAVVFGPSADHGTNVDAYVLELRRAGEALSASPVATRNLGKPQVVAGEISVDISAVVSALAPGSYYAAVFATGPGGNSTRAVSAEFSR